MNLDKALSIGDLRLLAKRRLPRILFELIESGVEDEEGLERNVAAFRDYRMMPRYLGDIHERDISTTLFGEAQAAPFGIAPTGFASLLRPGAEFNLAGAARDAGIPFIVSGAGAEPIEELVKTNPALWYHLYPAKDRRITDDIVSRVSDAGVTTLVLTVDNPVYPKRERDTRNGFSLPLRMRPSLILDGLMHPAWVLDYIWTGGIPVMDTWARYAPPGSNGAEVAAFFRSQSPSIQTWKDVEALRRRWPGRFLLKGLQHPDDARRAVDLGIDGVIVSNHGGKSFDKLPSPVETLPMVKEAVGGRIPVMLDSGIRRGADIAIALCLGADFVFVGRATLYGAVAGGRAGADRAVAILKQELDVTLAMIGCPRIADLGSHVLLGPRPPLPALAPPPALRAADAARFSAKRDIA